MAVVRAGGLWALCVARSAGQDRDWAGLTTGQPRGSRFSAWARVAKPAIWARPAVIGASTVGLVMTRPPTMTASWQRGVGWPASFRVSAANRLASAVVKRMLSTYWPRPAWMTRADRSTVTVIPWWVNW